MLRCPRCQSLDLQPGAGPAAWICNGCGCPFVVPVPSEISTVVRVPNGRPVLAVDSRDVECECARQSVALAQTQGLRTRREILDAFRPDGRFSLYYMVQALDAAKVTE